MKTFLKQSEAAKFANEMIKAGYEASIVRRPGPVPFYIVRFTQI